MSPTTPYDIQAQRRLLFRAVGERLVADLRAAKLGETDSGFQGSAAEAAFRSWLQRQIPQRYAAVSAAVLSSATRPTTQRDCLVFDSVDCAPFRTLGDQPDLLPVEGIVATIEVNTGTTGATRKKVLADAEKLTEISTIFADHRRGLLPRSQRLDPSSIAGVPTLQSPVWVNAQSFSLPPLKLIFAEQIRGSLADYATAIAAHNLASRVSASVDGLFVLDQGFVLHIMREGWAHHRIPGVSLAYCTAEPWEVLLKLMTILWSHLWKGPHSSPDFGAYYAGQDYFVDVEKPRTTIITGNDYASQVEPGFMTVHEAPNPPSTGA